MWGKPHEWEGVQFFKPWEFKCSHCGVERMQWKFVKRLDHLRDYLKHPMVITSGYRCPWHNANVSHTHSVDGPHVQGLAADIKISGEEAHRLVWAAMTMGFTGIGVQQKGIWADRFIHLDMVPGPLRLWSY